MKKIRLILPLLIIILAAIPCESNTTYATDAKGSTVWICGGPKSKRYHRTRSCPGLRRCSKTPKKITIEEAIQLGYTKCKKCG